jgi:hypothetical protein
MVNKPISITFVYEDILQRVTIEKIIRSLFTKKFVIETYLPGRGFSWIKNNINYFNRASTNTTFLILVDLDQDPCPSRKIMDWLEDPKGSNLLLRIAVKEIESWIVGDTKNFAKFLHVREDRLMKNVDSIRDPKKYIFSLAHQSGIRQLSGICPNPGARIGPEYNEKMTKFVNSSWNPTLAMKNSRSLKRSIIRLQTYSPIYSE